MIASAALDLVDEQGLEALSMRALARRLDVTPMALYNHVASKDELQGLVVDQLAEEMIPSTRSESWRDQIEDVATALRAVYLAHPASIVLVQTTDSTSERLLEPIELALDGFHRGGLTPKRCRTAWIGLVGLVTGHVAYEVRGHFVRPVDETTLAERFEHLPAVLAAGPADYDDAFAQALAWYLDGIEHSIRAT